MNIHVFCLVLDASREWVLPLPVILVPVTVQRVGLEPVERKARSLSCEALEKLLYLRCFHVLLRVTVLQIHMQNVVKRC